MASAGSARSVGVVLDVSHLVAQREEKSPTGIGRVELRYAHWLVNSSDLPSLLVHQVGNRLQVLPHYVAQWLVAWVARRWGIDRGSGPVVPRSPPIEDTPVANGGGPLAPEFESFLRSHAIVHYVNVSHHGLANSRLYHELLTKWQVRFVFYIHDMMPLLRPEYAMEQDVRTHESGLRNILPLDPVLLTSSEATKAELIAWCRKECSVEVEPVVLAAAAEDRYVYAQSTQADRQESSPQSGPPYFVMLGTIEPRKNHLLVLQLLGRMAATRRPEEVPRLLVIGRLGWGSDVVVSLARRSPSLRGIVRLLGQVCDDELIRLLRGARALLRPSFCEGSGLPVAEALALRVPVICSDLPVLRQASQGLAEYCDPLDNQRWLSVIADYACPRSEARACQLQRLDGSKPPLWSDHFAAFEAVLMSDGRAPPRMRRRANAGRIALPVRSTLGKKAPGIVDAVKSRLLRMTEGEAIAKADKHRDAREYDVAATHYRAALQRNPRNGPIWVQYGHMLKEHGDLQAAYGAYLKALDLMPDDVDLHIQLGHLFKVAGHVELANQYYRLAHGLDPGAGAMAHLV